MIELHAAHGYLLHQFMSPLSNKRDDQYGGSLENRIRLTLEVLQAMMAAVPEGYPIGVRISASDWMDQPDSCTIDSSIELSKALEAAGAAYIHISSAGLHVKQHIDVKPNYQVPFADAIKKVMSIPVIAVGLITEAEQAEDILQKARPMPSPLPVPFCTIHIGLGMQPQRLKRKSRFHRNICAVPAWVESFI